MSKNKRKIWPLFLPASPPPVFRFAIVLMMLKTCFEKFVQFTDAPDSVARQRKALSRTKVGWVMQLFQGCGIWGRGPRVAAAPQPWANGWNPVGIREGGGEGVGSIGV